MEKVGVQGLWVLLIVWGYFLAKYFLEKYSSQFQRPLRSFSPEALAVLSRYAFPGNVRELEGIVSAAVIGDPQALAIRRMATTLGTTFKRRAFWAMLGPPGTVSGAGVLTSVANGPLRTRLRIRYHPRAEAGFRPSPPGRRPKGSGSTDGFALSVLFYSDRLEEYQRPELFRGGVPYRLKS